MNAFMLRGTMEEIKITERISYLPSTEETLSADVGIIRGDSSLYLFDVGSGEKMLESVRRVIASESKKETVVIISHFHGDHLDNIRGIPYSRLYVGSHTAKYTKDGEIVDRPVEINDGIKLDIRPLTASHCKGSLMLCVDDKYLFIGDSAYCMAKREKPTAKDACETGAKDARETGAKDVCETVAKDARETGAKDACETVAKDARETVAKDARGNGEKDSTEGAGTVIRYVYNTQLLRDEIKELESITAEFIMTSHEKRFIKPKEAVLRMLKAVYEKRVPGETYIEPGDN